MDKIYGVMSDGALVRVILAGDSDAYEAVIARYKQMVYHVILHILPGDPDAEDVAQETFIDGYFRLSTLREPDALASWLYGIAKRKALHRYSRRRSYVDVEDLADFLASDPELDPETCVLKAETRDAVRRAMDVLSEKNRQVAEMFYFESMTVNAISARLALSEGTVKSRLHEARKKLKGALAYMIEQNEKKKSQSTLPDDFAATVRKKIEELRYYYALNGGSNEGHTERLTETEQMIDRLPESPEKHAALADVYMLAYWSKSNEQEKKEYHDRALAAARQGGNADVIATMWIDKVLDIEPLHRSENGSADEEWIRIIDEEALPELATFGKAGDNGRGQLLFWRGMAAIREKRLDEAVKNFRRSAELCRPEEIYRACSLCALRCAEYGEDMDDPTMGFNAVAETLIKKDGKLIFANQPGGSTQAVLWEMHRFDSIHYYLSRGGRQFYDTAMAEGETLRDSDGTSLTLVSRSAVAETPAGTFLACMHVHTDGDGHLSTDAYYAEGVGLVKAVMTDTVQKKSEVYQLKSYTVNGGEGYFPFAVGNRWIYENPELPPYLCQAFDCEICWTDGERATLSTLFTVNFKKNYQSEELGSEYYMERGERLCDEWKLEEAVEAFKQAVRANTNEPSVFAALNGIDVIGRMAEWKAKGWRFCPSSANTAVYGVADGKVTYDECAIYSFGPYRFGSRWFENRIFGVKAYRYLQKLTGCLWDPAWVPGYTMTRPMEDNKTVTLTVCEGGAITTPAGAFENTLKVTLVAEKEGAGDRYYFGNNYQDTDCGRKEYWFARGVGLVRFDCTWKEELSSSCQLVSYCLPAADDAYLPIQIGNRWEYDEMNLTAEGYRAKRISRVDCGRDGHYIVADNQEFVYQGTEEEYEAFKAGK
ncbi:MAG: sigma-70 family RNA polymerase sigma factor [Clostridia bacterium]|nr:sigma-70 family RNA polymerase sigma factor [Clostridia bacterium]